MSHKRSGKQSRTRRRSRSVPNLRSLAPRKRLNELLMRAARQGNVEKVRNLLGQGADVDARDVYGRTALILASEIVPTRDRIFSPTSACSAAIISFSAAGDHIGVVKLLLKAGANVNARDRVDRTVLMTAGRFGQTEVVRLLLAQPGIDVNARDRTDRTALMIVSFGGWVEIVELLLRHRGIDINARDKHGKTALDIARDHGNIEVVKEIETAMRKPTKSAGKNKALPEPGAGARFNMQGRRKSKRRSKSRKSKRRSKSRKRRKSRKSKRRSKRRKSRKSKRRSKSRKSRKSKRRSKSRKRNSKKR